MSRHGLDGGWTWALGAGWVGVNIHRVNAVIAEAAALGRLPRLERLRWVAREVPILASKGGDRAPLGLLLAGDDERLMGTSQN